MGNIYGNKFYSIYFNLNFPNCNVSLCAIEIGLNRGRLGFIRPVYGGRAETLYKVPPPPSHCTQLPGSLWSLVHSRPGPAAI